MDTKNETRELAQRKGDGLTVTLWWVKDTLATYVTVLDTKGSQPVEHMIDVHPPATPNDVFLHPFSYMADSPTLEYEAIDGKGTE